MDFSPKSNRASIFLLHLSQSRRIPSPPSCHWPQGPAEGWAPKQSKAFALSEREACVHVAKFIVPERGL